MIWWNIKYLFDKSIFSDFFTSLLIAMSIMKSFLITYNQQQNSNVLTFQRSNVKRQTFKRPLNNLSTLFKINSSWSRICITRRKNLMRKLFLYNEKSRQRRHWFFRYNVIKEQWWFRFKIRLKRIIIVEIIVDWEAEGTRKRNVIVVELHFEKLKLFFNWWWRRRWKRRRWWR